MRILYEGDAVTYHPQLGALVPGVEIEVPPHLIDAARLAVAAGLVREIAAGHLTFDHQVEEGG